MSFQSKISKIGTNDIPSFSQQLYSKELAKAQALFDENLENEVRKQLKANNILVPDKGTDWDTFIDNRLTKFTITGTNTNVISLDATMDGENNITDIGTILVKWQGDGYETTIQNPLSTVKTF